MTPQDIALVQGTYAQVAGNPAAVAELFYGRLFDQHPELRPLFTSDLTEQGRKLMAMLTAVVKGLNDLPRLIPVAQDLARRHVAYGVKDAHYAHVGSALLWTLSQGLGPAFTPEAEAAWTRAYTTLSGVMIDAAQASASS